MGRQRAWTVLVWGLGAAWLVMLGSALQFLVADMGVPAIYAMAGDGYPVVRAERPYSPLGDSALRPGDRLLEVNGKDLAGVGPVGFFRAATAPMIEPGVPVVYERDGIRATTHLPQVSHRLFRSGLLASLSLGSAALLLGLRARRNRAILWGVPAFLVGAIEMAGHPSAAYPFSAVLLPIWVASIGLFGPLILCAVTHFPDEDAPGLRWLRRLGWLALVTAPLGMSAAYGAWIPPIAIALPGLTLVNCVVIGGVVAVLTRNYVHADAIGRRQLRWTLLGVWVALLPALLLMPIVLIDASSMPLLFDALAGIALVPIFLGVSILRYNWFDVDRLLSATASYNLLGIVFVGLGLIVAPRVGQAASGALGIDATMGQTLTAFLLAAGAIPVHQRLRPRIDRLFFPERRAVSEGSALLLAALRQSTLPGELTEILGQGLYDLYRAESLAIYAPRDESWGLVFAKGPNVPPAIDAAAPLLPALAKRGRPLALDDTQDDALTPIDRALLETLDTRVVLPIVDESELALLVCLGAKGSGDVYTPTDLALLAGIAEHASVDLRAFDHTRRLDASKELQESLRRFVPGAIAEQLEGGRELGSRECEVSVLFVDIRGYTAWAEQRGAADVFATVNDYTQVVSSIVKGFGGSVVEFNGDGMMAVFGAPEPIPDKERAAVFAARELYAAVPQIDRSSPLRVGVGVATGNAFVGVIRAIDRLIWSAIGDTTNLAARLQSLTRELDAAVLVDEATYDAAGSAAEGFSRLEDVRVRGRRERMTLYSLALPPSADRGEPPENQRAQRFSSATTSAH